MRLGLRQTGGVEYKASTHYRQRFSAHRKLLRCRVFAYSLGCRDRALPLPARSLVRLHQHAAFARARSGLRQPIANQGAEEDPDQSSLRTIRDRATPARTNRSFLILLNFLTKFIHRGSNLLKLLLQLVQSSSEIASGITTVSLAAATIFALATLLGSNEGAAVTKLHRPNNRQ